MLASLLLITYGVLRTDDRADPRWLLLLAFVAVLWSVALWPRAPLARTARPVVHVGLALTVGFGLVAIQIVRAQLLDRERILARASDPTSGVVDVRRYLGQRDAVRGRILMRDGTIVAQDVVGPDGQRRRVYERASAAYLAGYYSPGLFGATGIEAAYDDVLSGQAVSNWRTWLDGILHRNRRGNDVVLTIDPELQELGQTELADRTGAIVVLDADSGAVLALVTSPGYDPNRLSVPLGATREDIERARAYLRSLEEDGRGPLLLRPVQGLYVPGSTFKTITAAAAFEFGIAQPDTVYRDDGALAIDSRVIIEQNRPDPSRVSFTVREAYGYSLNVVFAQIGLQLGSQRLEAMARAVGFGEAIPFDLPIAPSQIAGTPEFLTSRVGIAETAFGQGQLLVTPLQMALVTAAVVRDGTVPEPFLVQEVRRPDGSLVESRKPTTWRRAFGQGTAAQVRDLMIWSVEHGYARNARIEGAVVGGKTGTAEVGSGAPHAWFVGFGERDGKRVVVAVVVEHGGSGGQVALPIARALLEAALAPR
ncbi:MAG: penicillin-binding transpeptidase domain-containing protein [Thermomicrobium sp.]|nr:penicillin-binding transpeptidase domain-containing protein [Thermomicrobium sp.]MDW8058955.1 penicillin-binding transpeptidase domain-containing protein [Thermomicrobium sp.]